MPDRLMSQCTLAWKRYVSFGDANPPVRGFSRLQPVADLVVVNELRALDELPLEPTTKFYLHDNSDNGNRIYELLRQSEKNRDVSLLEEAGELLWEQSMKQPPHWQSPFSSFLPLNDLTDDVYRFRTMSNDPFAKEGSVKAIEPQAIPQKSARINSLVLSIAENHLEEPEQCAYPDLLINPPERWIKGSPRYSQPMPLIQPLALMNSYPMPVPQIQRQISATPNGSEQKKPLVSKKSNPTKASDTYRVLKPAADPKSKAKPPRKRNLHSAQQAGGSQGFQSLQQHPAPVINSNLLVPSWQQAYLISTPAPTGLQPTMNTPAYQSIYSTNTHQPPALSQTHVTQPTVNLTTTSNPFFAMPNRLPPPLTPGIYQASYLTKGHIPNPQSYHPAASQPPFIQLPAIRIPTTPIASNQQVQIDMPWLSLTHGSYTSVTSAAQAIGTQSYDEVYHIAKETADNLAEALGKK
jgi:hypothetical protein